MSDNTEKTGINFGNDKITVRDAHGTVDRAATMERIESELIAWIGTNEIDPEAVKTAVIAVFARFPKADRQSMDLGGLTHKALVELKAPDGSETRIGERIKNFVRGESERFENTQGAEGLCFIKRGKQGGVHMSTPAFVTEYRKGLAKKAAKETPAQ